LAREDQFRQPKVVWGTRLSSSKERRSEGRRIKQTTTAVCHGIKYTCTDIAFGTVVNVSVMYTTSIVGKGQRHRIFPLQYSDLPWFAHTRPSYLEFEQIPIGDAFKIVTRKNFGHE